MEVISHPSSRGRSEKEHRNQANICTGLSFLIAYAQLRALNSDIHILQSRSLGQHLSATQSRPPSHHSSNLTSGVPRTRLPLISGKTLLYCQEQLTGFLSVKALVNIDPNVKLNFDLIF